MSKVRGLIRCQLLGFTRTSLGFTRTVLGFTRTTRKSARSYLPSIPEKCTDPPDQCQNVIKVFLGFDRNRFAEHSEIHRHPRCGRPKSHSRKGDENTLEKVTEPL